LHVFLKNTANARPLISDALLQVRISRIAEERFIEANQCGLIDEGFHLFRESKWMKEKYAKKKEGIPG